MRWIHVLRPQIKLQNICDYTNPAYYERKNLTVTLFLSIIQTNAGHAYPCQLLTAIPIHLHETQRRSICCTAVFPVAGPRVESALSVRLQLSPARSHRYPAAHNFRLEQNRIRSSKYLRFED